MSARGGLVGGRSFGNQERTKMATRINFVFGKNSSFECNEEQVETSLDHTILGNNPWVTIKTSGGFRWINTARCTQIVIGQPDKAEEEEKPE
jgi:alpha-acetolactate decarboxylase